MAKEKKSKVWRFSPKRKESLKTAQQIHREMVELGKEVYYRKHK